MSSDIVAIEYSFSIACPEHLLVQLDQTVGTTTVGIYLIV